MRILTQNVYNVVMKEKVAQKLLKKVIKDYSHISEDFDQTRQHQWKEFEAFLPYLKENSSVVDIGCGNGRFYKFLKEKLKTHYTGIDNNPELIKIAKKTFKEANFIQGDLLKIPLKTASIDTALEIASLHHIPTKKLRLEAIKELYRILKNNGIAIITVWNLFQPKYKKYVWKARLKSLFGKYEARDTFIPWSKTGINRYYYAFKAQELRNLLEKQGFEVIKETHGNNFVFICKKLKS